MLKQGEPCPLCEAGTLKCAAPDHTITIGGVDVTDRTVMTLVCDRCGEALISAAQRLGYERRAAALILSDGRKVNPEVLRAARKALGLKQTELADLLEMNVSTVSRWESGAIPAQRPVQLALAGLLTDVERGVLDLEESLDVARASHPPDPPVLEVPRPRDGDRAA